MTVSWFELPAAGELPPGRDAEPTPGYPTHVDRRGFFALAGKLLLLVGLFSIGLATRARRAHADWPSYDEWINDDDPLRASACGQYDPDFWYGNDRDNNGWREPGTCTDDVCVGASDELMGPDFCTQCSERGDESPIQWHFRGRRGDYTYGDWSGGICDPGRFPYVGGRDAWRWAVSSCGDCAPAVFRCHDGYKRYPSGATELTICQALVACNGDKYQPC